jgi:hypothetical protein
MLSAVLRVRQVLQLRRWSNYRQLLRLVEAGASGNARVSWQKLIQNGNLFSRVVAEMDSGKGSFTVLGAIANLITKFIA